MVPTPKVAAAAAFVAIVIDHIGNGDHVLAFVLDSGIVVVMVTAVR